MSPPSPRLQAALSEATSLARAPLPAPARSAGSPARCFALGDPQATCLQLFGALDAHGLLGEDGRLAGDASLLSIGDHFDFGIVDRPELLATAREDGVRFLRWLASHPSDRVTVLLGNHDTARVMELAHLSDADFAEARVLAAEIESLGGAAAPEAASSCDAFALRFPEIPTPGIAHRDFGAFTEEQRDCVIRCLLAGRFRLAAVGIVLGREVLFVHAGVTRRELSLLGIPGERDPRVIARALNHRLTGAVDAVRSRWERGERASLDLSPLHLAGVCGVEGGGLLYHRPANPTPPRARPDLTWQFNAQRPRRFDPLGLPEDLVQVVGHTSHKACVRDLEPWYDPTDSSMTMDALVPLRTLRARPPGGERPWRPGDSPLTLAVTPPRGGASEVTLRAGQARYQTGIVPGEPGEAVLHLIDPAFYRQNPGEAFSLLPVEAWVDID